VFRLSFRSSVRIRPWIHPSFRSSVTELVNTIFSILKTSVATHYLDVATLMPIGTSSPQGMGMKRSLWGVSKSKVRVAQGRRYIGMPGGGIILDPPTPFVEHVFWFQFR